MKKLISFFVWIDTKIHKYAHNQWTGFGGYWISYGKIGRKRESNKDVELVIKIDEKLYEIITDPEKLETMYHAGRVCEAIRNGIPLADVLNKIRAEIENDWLTNYPANQFSRGVTCGLKLALKIINKYTKESEVKECQEKKQ